MTTPDTKTFAGIGETVHTGKLDNGLTIYTIPKAGYSKSYAFFAANYGGADRRFKLGGQWIDTPAGIAHFLEHKMFDTSDGNALTNLAANGASPNAFTSNEITAYYFECTEGFYDNLKTLLSFVSIPYFTDESVSKEQGIIGQEICMINDNPASRTYYNYLKALYRHHPARDTIAGTEESIAGITAKTLYDCHKVFYNPANMVLCVVGDVDSARIADIAGEVLPKDSGEVPEKDYGSSESAEPFMACMEEAMEVSLPMFMAGTKLLGNFTGDDYLRQELTGDLATAYLAGTSSPLYSNLYSDGLITSNFEVGVDMGRSLSVSVFSGESREPDRVVDAIREEIRRTVDAGMDSRRVERLKRKKTGDIIRGFNRFDNICYGQAEAHFAGTSELRRAEVLKKINERDLLDFIREHLKPENFAVSLVRPAGDKSA